MVALEVGKIGMVVVASLKADQAFEDLSVDFVWKSGSVALHCCISLFGLADSSNLACCTEIQKLVASLVLVTLLEFE